MNKPGRPKQYLYKPIRSTIYIDRELWKDFRKYCVDNEINGTKLINDFIREKIKKVS